MSPKEVDVVKVHHHDGPLLLPEKMTAKAAIEVLKREMEYEAEAVKIVARIPGFVWDGALALSEAIRQQFGYSHQQSQTIEGFFGSWKVPPSLQTIACGVDETTLVPWGQIALPGIEGNIVTQVGKDEFGRVVLVITATTTHAHEKQIQALFALTKRLVREKSIYRGKAISIAFAKHQRDSDKDEPELYPIPVVSFMRLSPNPPIFSARLERALDVAVMTPIRHTSAVRSAGIPLKRGVLLAGAYGTGKTLAAAEIARVCSASGWTFIYIQEVSELSHAIRFATAYQPAVVFAEDVDRAAGRDRDASVNTLLNTLDGIDSKATEVMVVLTSNHPEQLSPAMRRPGRIDVILEISTPDAEAVGRLIRWYSGTMVPSTEHLGDVGELLAGQIPAVIREVVERSKLAAIARDGIGDTLIASDLMEAATILLAEQRLFRVPEVDGHTALLNRVAGHLTESLGLTAD